jgi:hypothetical protein
LKTFFGQSFKVQDWWKLVAEDDENGGKGDYRKRGKCERAVRKRPSFSVPVSAISTLVEGSFDFLGYILQGCVRPSPKNCRKSKVGIK